MRRICIALPMLLVTGMLFAQQTTPPTATPPAPPLDPKLDEVLSQWEKVMTSMQSLAAQCTRTTINKAFQSTEVYEGGAKFLKANQPNLSSRASLEMFKKGRPEVFEKYVCTGAFLYEFVPSSKVVRVHQLPPPKQGQLSDDNFISFVFGMKAAEAKARYDIVYVPASPNDKWYYYLRILPRADRDKADFTEARLVLSASTFLPRQLWFKEPNGNEITWDFPKVGYNAEVRATDFDRPALPAGWQLIQAPKENQARVIRPNQ